MSGFEVYILFVLLPNVALGLEIISVLSAIVILFLGFVFLAEVDDQEECKQTMRFSCKSLGLCIALFLMTQAVPNKAEMAMIYLVPAITQVKDVEKLPEALVNKLLKYLEEENQG
jgi:hypothetical protein